MKKTALFLSMIFAAQTAGATEWNILGARAMGMAGANVALAQGAVGSYWNPAALGQVENPSGLQVPVSVHATVPGTTLLGANDLKTLGDNCPTCTQADIDKALHELGAANSGALVNAGAGIDLKFGKIVFFANNFTYAGAKPIVDYGHDTPTTLKSQNLSELAFHGLLLTEFGLGYGHELPWVPGVLVGANLKGLVGRVAYTQISVFQGNDSANDDLKNYKQSFAPAVDVGAFWDVNRTFETIWWRPRVGLTARNINDPKFDESVVGQSQGGLSSKYSLQGNARLGVAISPFHWWNLAADLDLTRNVTALPGVLSQELALGTEINIFNRTWINIPLRAGIRKNIAEKGSKTAVAAGFGLNFLHLIVDVAATATPAMQQIDSVNKSTKIPTDLGAAVQLGIMFGGGQEKKPAPVVENSEPSAAPAVEQAPSPAPATPGSEVDRVKQNAEKAQQELDKAAAPAQTPPANP